MDTPRRLVLVRHGETDWNRDGRLQGQADIPLNERGRAQAAAAAARFGNGSIDVLQTSTLARARETADIIGRVLGLAPEPVDGWRELHVGDLDGMSHVEVARRHGELISTLARHGEPLGEGGESFADYDARVRAAYRDLCARHAGRSVMVVGHGGTLKALIALLIGLPPEHVGHLSLRHNGSVSIVDYRWGRPQLTLLNSEADHVPA